MVYFYRMSNKRKQLVEYWQKTAEHDYVTMISLYKARRFSDSLFFGHIILEKVLKGLVVLESGKQAPFTHDLLLLVKLLPYLALTEKEMNLLSEVGRFNIRTRYPDVKFRFYKQCTAIYTKRYFSAIDDLYQKLCQEIRQKK